MGVVDQVQVGLGIFRQIARGDELPFPSIVHEAQDNRSHQHERAGQLDTRINVRFSLGV
jgi:hypothetical protein